MPSGFRADIQGLRAIAVLLVVLYHAGVPGLGGGYVGVDVFFVISGFLISGILLGDLDRLGQIRFAEFYRRRVRRILPAALVVVVATALAAWFVVPPLQRGTILLDALYTALFIPNVHFANADRSYLADLTPSAYQQYWSLGVEEQFYLIWPLLLGLGFLFLRRRWSSWAKALVIGIPTVASFVACVLLTQAESPWAFFGPQSRAWEFGLGAITAIVLGTDHSWLRSPAVGIVSWLGLAGILVAAVAFSDQTPFPGIAALLPVVSTAAVLVGGRVPLAWHPTTALRWHPLQFIGLISYSIYLVHWPLLQIPEYVVVFPLPLPDWWGWVLGLLSVPVGYILYRFVERPMRRPSAMSPRVTIIVGVAFAGVVALAAFGADRLNAALPLTSDRVAPALELVEAPSGTPFVPVNLQPSLLEIANDIPTIYEDGCHRTAKEVDPSGCRYGEDLAAPEVALFGDSHAAQWFPALQVLADEGLIRLTSYTKSSCAAALLPASVETQAYPECVEWREGVFREIASSQPQFVMLGAYSRYQVGSVDGTPELWRASLQTTVDRLRQQITDVDVLILADTPEHQRKPSLCLSLFVDDVRNCAIARTQALNSEVRGAEAAVNGARYADFTNWLCDAERCPAVLGQVQVYRDEHHLSATMAAALAPIIGGVLTPS